MRLGKGSGGRGAEVKRGLGEQAGQSGRPVGENPGLRSGGRREKGNGLEESRKGGSRRRGGRWKKSHQSPASQPEPPCSSDSRNCPQALLQLGRSRAKPNRLPDRCHGNGVSLAGSDVTDQGRARTCVSLAPSATTRSAAAILRACRTVGAGRAL